MSEKNNYKEIVNAVAVKNLENRFQILRRMRAKLVLNI